MRMWCLWDVYRRADHRRLYRIPVWLCPWIPDGRCSQLGPQGERRPAEGEHETAGRRLGIVDDETAVFEGGSPQEGSDQ